MQTSTFVWILSVSIRKQVNTYQCNYKVTLWKNLPQDSADLWVRLSKAAYEEVTDRTCRGIEPHLESLWAIGGMFIILCLLFWVCTLPLPFFVSLCYLCSKIPLGVQGKSSGIVQFPLPGSCKSLSLVQRQKYGLISNTEKLQKYSPFAFELYLHRKELRQIHVPLAVKKLAFILPKVLCLFKSCWEIICTL